MSTADWRYEEEINRLELRIESLQEVIYYLRQQNDLLYNKVEKLQQLEFKQNRIKLCKTKNSKTKQSI